MTGAPPAVAAHEDLRLETCSQEPIHVPGAIQPHGALLVVDPDSMEIIQASANTSDVLGLPARELLGARISALVGTRVEASLSAGLADGGESETNPLRAEVNGQDFDVIVRPSDGVGIVEFEPALTDSDGRDYLPALHAAIQRLSRVTDLTELRRVAAREMRRLTGFDQVMVYHFHPDGHGEVVADDHADHMPSHLGLHFPASDIPTQARQLYLRKGSGLIARTDYLPSPLIPVDNPRTGRPVDLGRAELRSVSPFHLQFMRNMGQGASLTLSLALGGELLGLITCAHPAPRRIPYLLRRAGEILAQQLTLQLDANIRTVLLTGRLRAQDLRMLLDDQMNADLDVVAGLTERAVTLLDLIQADGASVCLQQRLTSIGRTPTDAQTMDLVAALTEGQPEFTPLVSEYLVVDHPELAVLVPSVAGVLLLPFGNAGDCLIWWRGAIPRAVNWLGDQSADNRPTALSPRTSFDQWRQTVTDRSASWDEMQLAEAVELCRDINQVLLRLTEAQMAHMALHDALTGLPNRRLLIDRISSALDRAERHGLDVAILFCDLDDFKRVNDTAGHAAGDAVLVEAAGRITSVLRAGDSIARVGGDEFVIVLEPGRPGDPAPPGTLADPHRAATDIAERIKTELTRPISYQDQEHLISVSVGITFASGRGSAEDALRDADAAMYRAKQSGKNRVATFDDSLRAGALARAAAEHALQAALHPSGPGHLHPRLTVRYQPVIHPESGWLAGFEAVPQLTDPTGERIPDEVLTYVAEHTPMISLLGATVLDTALAALVEWRQHLVSRDRQADRPADAPAVMAVQLSARQAQQADMPGKIRAALERHGLQPADLVLELTESVLIEAGSSTLRQIAELRADGVTIGINDFGNGHASLGLLASLPVDVIRVNRSFTTGLPYDAISTKIVRAIAGLAEDLGLPCVFTGIDSAAQLAALPSGVLAQGNVLGRSADAPRDDIPRPGVTSQ